MLFPVSLSGFKTFPPSATSCPQLFHPSRERRPGNGRRHWDHLLFVFSLVLAWMLCSWFISGDIRMPCGGEGIWGQERPLPSALLSVFKGREDSLHAPLPTPATLPPSLWNPLNHCQTWFRNCSACVFLFFLVGEQESGPSPSRSPLTLRCSHIDAQDSA